MLEQKTIIQRRLKYFDENSLSIIAIGVIHIRWKKSL